jgi:short subunit fatty acids transporter
LASQAENAEKELCSTNMTVRSVLKNAISPGLGSVTSGTIGQIVAKRIESGIASKVIAGAGLGLLISLAWGLFSSTSAYNECWEAAAVRRKAAALTCEFRYAR